MNLKLLLHIDISLKCICLTKKMEMITLKEIKSQVHTNNIYNDINNIMRNISNNVILIPSRYKLYCMKMNIA